jgi:hypothetical protein
VEVRDGGRRVGGRLGDSPPRQDVLEDSRGLLKIRPQLLASFGGKVAGAAGEEVLGEAGEQLRAEDGLLNE